MPDFSNVTKGKVVDWLCGGADPDRPAAQYLALFSAAPTDAGGGTEISAGGYTRQAITFAAWDGSSAVNTNEITFSAVGGDFGAITHGAIFDAATSGNFLMWAALSSPKTIPSGDRLAFDPGTVAVGMS